jgi:3-methyladenine DNA glycosylase Tag
MLKSEKISTKELERISSELERWNLNVNDTERLSILAGETILRELHKLQNERENLRRVSRINKLFPIFAKFNLEPNLHQSQNLYFETSLELKSQKQTEIDPEWTEQFSLLGDNLGVRVE